MKNYEHSFVAHKCHTAQKICELQNDKLYRNYMLPLRFMLRPIHLAWLLAIVLVGDNRKQFKESLISHVIYLLLFRTSIVCAFFMRVCVCVGPFCRFLLEPFSN